MNIYNLLASTIASTTWSAQVAAIMIICNLIAIFIGYNTIQVKNQGTSIPIGNLENLGLVELLSATSLGHIIGAGSILGLRSIGILH
jgi:photosystem I subunit 10|uniref:Photosystem I reaction center subunit PsaK n=1 Tax=Kumanoa mahlacensis TaxID=1196387 RepID=A0A8K1YU99_9FLOR|nr:photosystem I subunit X [Kumanoa mahlacensis]